MERRMKMESLEEELNALRKRYKKDDLLPIIGLIESEIDNSDVDIVMQLGSFLETQSCHVLPVSLSSNIFKYIENFYDFFVHNMTFGEIEDIKRISELITIQQKYDQLPNFARAVLDKVVENYLCAPDKAFRFNYFLRDTGISSQIQESKSPIIITSCGINDFERIVYGSKTKLKRDFSNYVKAKTDKSKLPFMYTLEKTSFSYELDEVIEGYRSLLQYIKQLNPQSTIVHITPPMISLLDNNGLEKIKLCYQDYLKQMNEVALSLSVSVIEADTTMNRSRTTIQLVEQIIRVLYEQSKLKVSKRTSLTNQTSPSVASTRINGVVQAIIKRQTEEQDRAIITDEFSWEAKLRHQARLIEYQSQQNICEKTMAYEYQKSIVRK